MALFATCYGNRNEPELDEDLAAVFEHNGIEVALLPRERCCGMPRLELGDLEAVAKLKEQNIPQLCAGGRGRLRHRRADSLLRADVQAGTAADVSRGCAGARVAEHIFDPFEYLMLRHQAGLLRTDFKARWARSATTCPATCACRTSA